MSEFDQKKLDEIMNHETEKLQGNVRLSRPFVFTAAFLPFLAILIFAMVCMGIVDINTFPESDPEVRWESPETGMWFIVDDTYFNESGLYDTYGRVRIDDKTYIIHISYANENLNFYCENDNPASIFGTTKFLTGTFKYDNILQKSMTVTVRTDEYGLVGVGKTFTFNKVAIPEE